MHILAIVSYLLLSYIIGLLGKNKKFGLCGYFLLSILLTPMIGLLLVIASDTKNDKLAV